MWRMEQSTALWHSERFFASVDLTRPFEGIRQARFRRASLDGAQLMQVAVPTRARGLSERVEDAYVRGPDLIVTYAETTQSPVRPQVCWRILDQPLTSPGIVVEAIVSTQTRWLDSDPRIQIASAIPGREWLLLAGDATTSGFRPIVWEDASSRMVEVSPAGTAFLARIPASANSYGHVVVANDLLGAHLIWDPVHHVTTLSAMFFGGRLEKGILRRVRSRAILVPRERDEELLAELLMTSLAAAPPLTA